MLTCRYRPLHVPHILYRCKQNDHVFYRKQKLMLRLTVNEYSHTYCYYHTVTTRNFNKNILDTDLLGRL